MTGQPGGIEGLLGGPRRATILLLVFIVVTGLAIGTLAYTLFSHRNSASAPQVAPHQGAPAAPSDQPSQIQPRGTVTVTASPSATVTVSAPPPPAMSSTAVPTEQRSPVWTGVIVGTCDESSSCGVQQRTAPYNDAPRLYPNDLKDGMTVSVVCQTPGDIRSNKGYGTSYFWYQLNNGAYVNSVYISVPASRISAC